MEPKKSFNVLSNSQLNVGQQQKPVLGGQKKQQDLVSIEPQQLLFKDAVMGKEYTHQLIIRNKTTQITRIKVQDPRTQAFQIDHDSKTNVLSTGLCKKIKIRFACKTDADCYDQIKVLSENKTYIVPIKAIRAVCDIKYSTIIEGGVVALSTKHKFTLSFVNTGDSVNIKLIKQSHESILIQPDQFTVEQGRTQEVGISVIPNTTGTYRHKILVEVNDRMSEPVTLIYSATEFKFFLTSEEGKVINEVDLGYSLYGIKKTCSVFAVNNTPAVITLKSKIRLGWKFNESALQSPQELGIESSSTIIEVSPNQAEIRPFSKVPLTLSFSHPVTHDVISRVSSYARRQENKKNAEFLVSMAQILKMNDSQIHETLIAEFEEKKIYCSLKAVCGYPLLKIEPSSVVFGQTPIKKTVSRKIKVLNTKQNVALKVTFPKTFSFEIIPSAATIEPNSHQQFQVFLTPVSYGVFSSAITCTLFNLYKIEIPVSYTIPSEAIKKQSVSLHHSSSQPIIKEMGLISAAMHNEEGVKQLRNSRSQVNFKIKSGHWSRASVHAVANKEPSNMLESTQDLFAHRAPTFEVNDCDEEILAVNDKAYKLPKTKDTLFVTRKVEKYEPYKNISAKFKQQSREIGGQFRKIPRNRKQHLEVCKQLPVEALKNVLVAEKIINFGKVFVHSKIVKQFEITNNNDFSILVKLTPNHEYLSETDSQSQVLPSKTKFKFKVVLCPKACGQFQSLVEYSINSLHQFKFLVQAEVQLVTLALSKNNLKLCYQDEAKDMYLSDTFQLKNEGNTEAYFQIEQNTESLTIQPKSAMLASGEAVTISVLYNQPSTEVVPAGQPKNVKDYNKPTVLNVDERVIVKVKNGVDMFLRVQSSLPEPRCYIKESKINFGCCIVPKSKSKSFVLRNLSRNLVLYQIDMTGCESLLQFDAIRGKVLPESSKQITVTYKSNTIHEVNMNFRVMIRGGAAISVPFHAESIAPKISVLQNSFNFGEICCGSTGVLPITIKNDSETMVELILDLLTKHHRGSQFLDFSYDVQDKEENKPVQRVNKEPAVHKIKVESKSTLKFYLIFQPHVPGFYEFELPIFIENFIKNDMICKIVSCYAKEPKFFLEPSLVKFKKKIINQKDNACFHPLVEFVTLKNPSDVVLKWKIELPKVQNGKKLCFQIENRKGEVKAKSWQCINIAFNPYEQGVYSYKFPVMIFNWERNEYLQQAEIKVEGEGQYPILLFDRKQLILPVVPLQVESVGMFKIINEGYETIDIKHRIYSLDELLLIPDIILFYPEGSKMGINKKQLYVIVKFVSKKPVSFTVKLQIYDGCRIYQLPISGTSDNSLFTTFPYLSDKENLYKLEYTNDSINLRNIDTRNIIDKIHNHYDQVTEADYRLPCEVIRRWINTVLKDQKVIRFPEDVVSAPQNFLKFLYRITNKKELEKPNPEADTPQKFYEWVIRVLKSMGCLLNHIRPYYLLEKNDFAAIFQNPSLRHMTDTYKKYYRVIHLESWVILFYQVVSNFWYNPQKIKVVDLKSNVYSCNEIQVLKWIRQVYAQYNQSDDRKFVDLNKDFKDCFAPIYTLYHYNFMNKNQSLEGLNKHVVSTGDYATNIRMLYSMMARANLIPLISEDEYQQIKDKQVYMLLYQLYESLPQQLPKTAPIIFSCQLGQKCTKFIEIKNPSSKYVHYWIRVEGSTDYYVEEKESIKIEPKGVYRLAVEFRSRVSQEEVAFLVLFSKKQLDNNSGNGCSLVFELKSQIVGRKSIKKLETLRCPLYESTSIKVPVENTFNDKQFGNFKITLAEELTETKQSPKIYNFYLEVDTVKIRRNSSVTIELFYSPMILKSVRCFLIFCDPTVGEFQYEVAGVPQVPKPLQEIKVQNPIYINTSEAIEVSLPVYNNLLIKSQAMMEQKWEMIKSLNRANCAKPCDMISFGEDDKEELEFKVESNMDPKILQFVKFPSDLIIFQRKRTKTDIRNKLKIECNFSIIIKDLVLDLILISNDKRDVRRFKVLVTVTSQPIVTNLIMKTNARTPLVQEIPFENTSAKDWKINCQITDTQSSEFSLKQGENLLQKDYICKKNGSAAAHFVYSPDWISESACKLKITNTATNEQIIYNIKGVSEQPLSQDHIFITTFTGKSNLNSIQIKNPYPEKLSYFVSTDLLEIECSPEVTFEPSEKTSFNIIVSAGSPGVYIGYIKFTDKAGRYFWYSVTIEAEDHVIAEETVKLESLVDKEIEKVLEVKNTLAKTVTYKVDLDSEYLSGERNFDVKPYSSYLYRLKFKPTKVIKQEVNVRIFSPDLGACLYKVEISSFEHYKRQLMSLKVEVGRVGFREIKMAEIADRVENLSISVSNPSFFAEYNQKSKEGDLALKIFYRPLTEGSEKCAIKVIYGFNQTKIYEIEGIGIAPFTVETVEFQSVDLAPRLQIIKFKNPNITAGSEIFTCSLQRNEMNFFKIVGYGDKFESKIGDLLAIPIEFKPTHNGEFESMLWVQTDQYRWQYLLKGVCITEGNKNQYDEEIKTRTRQEAIKVFTMQIPEFLKQEGLKPNKIQVCHPEPKTLALIKSWLKLKIEANGPKEDSKTTLYLRFRPNKPIKQIVTFSLFNSLQESIKLNKKVKLVSQPPEPEQTMKIEINSIKTHLFMIPIKMETEYSSIQSRMEKGEYFQSSIIQGKVQLKFSPSNCTFKNHAYTDLLIIESEQEYRSFKIEVRLRSKALSLPKKKQ